MRTFIFMLLFFGISEDVSSDTGPHIKKENTIEIQIPWARVTNGRHGACYVAILSTADDKLMSAKAPSSVCKHVELHTHTDDHGVMKMRRVSSLEIKAKEYLVMQPGGIHIMLMDLKKPLKNGDQFNLTLQFRDAGDLSVAVTVQQRIPVSSKMMPILAPKDNAHCCCQSS